MDVHLKPETGIRLQALAEQSGRAPDELVEDAMAGYLAELTALRKVISDRYDDIRSGKVTPVDGEQAFEQLRAKSRDRRSHR
jgi:predicted transcriptional regulator